MYPSKESLEGRQDKVLATFNAFLSLTTPNTAGDASLIQEKESSLDALLSLLNPESGSAKNWSDALICKAFECIKVMGREKDGSDPLYTDQGIKTLSYHAGLVSTSTVPVDSQRSLEAMRCLANILLLEPETRLPFTLVAGVSSLAKHIQNPNLSLDCQFLTYRLIFLVTANNVEQCNDLIAFPKMATIALDHVKPLVAKAVSATLTPGDKHMMVLGEIFKVVFNIVSAFETAEDPAQKPIVQRTTQDQIDAFQTLVYYVAQYVKAIKIPSPPLSPPLTTAIHALMNVTSLFWKEAYFASKDYSVLIRVLDLLEHTLALQMLVKGEGEGDENPGWETDLPPVFILLTRMTRAEEGARKMIRGRLTPESIDRKKHLNEGHSITNYMIRFMTSITLPHVRETACELLFASFNESPQDLVAYTGLGHAAGFLVQRGLMPSTLPSTSASSSSDTMEVDPVTGEIKRDEDAEEAWNNMTDEEREQEAEKMFMLFDKLNKTGIIQVLPQQGGNGRGVARALEKGD
ncbi:hypothetical protein SmJEL517_g03312 [Synchytrium microbalum]|uniref:Uncharacterized protein n=1 Tax=Synchytrium microbalum TaxID=1806994 RepID=A0A507C473_9FUNG|nr:uncharacterized protein SmJEL517_g03312 [Synchytrium microbalum]TPX33889.1 hypothetical protein SmJEL517_g03312 [Synchytrium microbalum]